MTSAAAPFRRLSVLMAVFNEEKTIATCVTAVLAAPLPDGLERELVIVDDGSSDGTVSEIRKIVARHPDAVRVVTSDVNRGKGAALRRAIGEMTSDIAIFQDADFEYDPGDIWESIHQR